VERDGRKGLSWLARFGLAARGGFYLIVAAVAVEIGVDRYQSRQGNANGALAIITRPTGGKALVAAVAMGFVAFGIESLVRSWRLRQRDLRRCVFAGLRGVFYLALAWVPVDYLSGNHSAGSEQQQHHTASELLGFSGGEFLVILAGLAVIAACAWQIYNAVDKDPTDRLDLSSAPRPMRTLTPILARVGVLARATMILPIGVFLVVAAIEYDPRRATGMDGELADLASHEWGRALLFLVAAGLTAFGLYSFLEARYRDLALE
jgi:hypothetical protein